MQFVIDDPCASYCFYKYLVSAVIADLRQLSLEVIPLCFKIPLRCPCTIHADGSNKWRLQLRKLAVYNLVTIFNFFVYYIF